MGSFGGNPFCSKNIKWKDMSQTPSYKVIAPFAAIYALCLFLPTIDALATVSFKLFFFTTNFSVAILIFPAIYPLADSLTEVYGKEVSYYVTMFCYIIIVIFSLINNILLSHVDNKNLYEFIIKPSLIITIAGPISYVITSLLNINIIYKLKIKMRKAHFILRSFICSAISGFIMSLIVQGSLYYQYGFKFFFKMFISIFLLKIIVTIPYVYLAKLLVILYRFADKIELEEYNKKLASHNNKTVFA
jgi:uncharacterized PurR-regulated membrane protein YhhQ (DUF165 family)